MRGTTPTGPLTTSPPIHRINTIKISITINPIDSRSLISPVQLSLTTTTTANPFRIAVTDQWREITTEISGLKIRVAQDIGNNPVSKGPNNNLSAILAQIMAIQGQMSPNWVYRAWENRMSVDTVRLRNLKRKKRRKIRRPLPLNPRPKLPVWFNRLPKSVTSSTGLSNRSRWTFVPSTPRTSYPKASF